MSQECSALSTRPYDFHRSGCGYLGSKQQGLDRFELVGHSVCLECGESTNVYQPKVVEVPEVGK